MGQNSNLILSISFKMKYVCTKSQMLLATLDWAHLIVIKGKIWYCAYVENQSFAKIGTDNFKLVYVSGIHREREREKEREGERDSIHWFTSQIAATSRDGPVLRSRILIQVFSHMSNNNSVNLAITSASICISRKLTQKPEPCMEPDFALQMETAVDSLHFLSKKMNPDKNIFG